jgi:hypothetical protein
MSLQWEQACLAATRDDQFGFIEPLAGLDRRTRFNVKTVPGLGMVKKLKLPSGKT